jgi:hypothetical protein
MPSIFTLTDDEVQIMADAIDTLMENTGKNCQLIYQGRRTPCNNCNLAQTSGGTLRSLNTYKAGGPRPFPNGSVCPVCQGTAYLALPERTENIRLLLRWNPANFMMLPGTTLEVPYSVVESEGYITDWPKVQQARVMIIELPIAPYIKARFELSGEPTDVNSIKQGYTFTCHWKRAG